jgi:hypothetical protein
MTNKELQAQINELQKRLDEMQKEDELKEWWYLCFNNNVHVTEISDSIAAQPIEHLFEVVKSCNLDSDQPHGFGRYRTKEYAEMARAYLIDLLNELKIIETEPDFGYQHEGEFKVSSQSGKRIIKRLTLAKGLFHDE